MASGGQQPAGPDLAGPATRVVVALGRPTDGPQACRVESPERVMRVWEMLSEAGEGLQPATMAPAGLARVQRLLGSARAELQRSVSPALVRELRQLIDCSEAERSASEVRIEYASVLGWLSGLVAGMYSQLQDARDDLVLDQAQVQDQGQHHPGAGPRSTAGEPGAARSAGGGVAAGAK